MSICETCNKTFEKKGPHHKGRFCSFKCKNQGMFYSKSENHPRWKPKTKRPCKICGKIMYLAPWQIKNSIRYNRIYCSLKCKNIGISFTMAGKNAPSWNNGSSSYWKRNGPGFTRTIRKFIHTKNGNKCSFCGTNKKLNIHHKDFNPKNNTFSNLISVCKPCHSTFHGLVKSYLNSGIRR